MLLVRTIGGLGRGRLEVERAIGELTDRPDLAARGITLLAQPIDGLTPLSWHESWRARAGEVYERLDDTELRLALTADRIAAASHVGDGVGVGGVRSDVGHRRHGRRARPAGPAVVQPRRRPGLGRAPRPGGAAGDRGRPARDRRGRVVRDRPDPGHPRPAGLGARALERAGRSRRAAARQLSGAGPDRHGVVAGARRAGGRARGVRRRATAPDRGERARAGPRADPGGAVGGRGADHGAPRDRRRRRRVRGGRHGGGRGRAQGRLDLGGGAGPGGGGAGPGSPKRPSSCGTAIRSSARS